MRVIAGQAKGFPLKVPKGTPTRPATELVRGAIFSILESSVEDWAQVLDIFSGSGSLGIEALSRGAGWVDFVDQEPRCCAIIKENLNKTNLAGQARVYCQSVERAISLLDKEYNIILMDPPYSNTDIGKIIEKMANSRLVGARATIIITHSSRSRLNQSYGPIKLQREYRHGDSVIAVYRKETPT